MRATTSRGQPFIRRLKRGHSEVNYLDIARTIHQNIFWLEIPMADVEAMTIR